MLVPTSFDDMPISRAINFDLKIAVMKTAGEHRKMADFAQKQQISDLRTCNTYS
jgi:hypothetical protein